MLRKWIEGLIDRALGAAPVPGPAPVAAHDRPRTTRQMQAAPICRQFGEDLRATTVDVRSLDEWLARIAVLEWEYSMRVPRELWIQAHNDAIDQIHLYRASLRNTITQHHRRASRIHRASLA